METVLTASAYEEAEVARRGPWAQATRRFRKQKLAVVALAILLLIFMVGALASVIAPYSYDRVDLAQIGKPATAPSWHHLFGTDDLGHDMFSQTLYGVRTSVEVALMVGAIAAFIGVSVGVLR